MSNCTNIILNNTVIEDLINEATILELFMPTDSDQGCEVCPNDRCEDHPYYDPDQADSPPWDIGEPTWEYETDCEIVWETPPTKEEPETEEAPIPMEHTIEFRKFDSASHLTIGKDGGIYTVLHNITNPHKTKRASWDDLSTRKDTLESKGFKTISMSKTSMGYKVIMGEGNVDVNLYIIKTSYGTYAMTYESCIGYSVRDTAVARFQSIERWMKNNHWNPGRDILPPKYTTEREECGDKYATRDMPIKQELQ